MKGIDIFIFKFRKILLNMVYRISNNINNNREWQGTTQSSSQSFGMPYYEPLFVQHECDFNKRQIEAYNRVQQTKETLIRIVA